MRLPYRIAKKTLGMMLDAFPREFLYASGVDVVKYNHPRERNRIMKSVGTGKIYIMVSVIVAVLVLESVLFAQPASSSNVLAWAWNVTVEDPQGRIDSSASVCLLIDTTISLEALDAAIAKGSFDPKTALQNFTLKQGTQTVYFKVPHTTEEFNKHGIYALFSATNPLKSKYYSVGYFSAFRDDMARLSPGFYYDSRTNLVPCYCNMSMVSLANAKRTGWNGVVTSTNHPFVTRYCSWSQKNRN